ncbi:uncharacterized protein MONOS_15616 [Monocercomonoides exilis]|uniref:uncharacterized protein n=1 Tax=Monocercomonoides exilis TaxID=2049356 RepID=UPI00355AA22F|nr:hypothetical protein MONOS_15616 [Monocercomonoides exilis]|eukprot:MONOS_15616.1-p1 / transcript=MONOS_15616.1 / gene=MONOS_15616 / organism=Monocercomonoides_exilis_PA203 / gene_product=unspecified product / transcript_product=unspecified product / location=Mono_scaffold01288:10208-12436(+) / protein_length=527 / sequence_SO=supercontig / SO=protein_coding / is_pseudo=false
MNGCSFSSVSDAYDGGIVHSLNNPLASLSVSNTSFIGCCRTRNVECIGTETNRLAPGRQNITENGPNTFIWCEWDGSKATGKGETYSDGTSNGGAIFIGCEFQNCKANNEGGGLYLNNFQVSGIGCVGNESGEGESACVFDCCFTSCSVTSTLGGGLRCYNIPVQVKIRSIQFISCNASAYGGGLSVDPRMTTAPKDGHYFYFLFFHECKCRTTSNPYGHDVMYYDYYNAISTSDNPFYECYTTNTDDQRVCYGYDYSSSGSWKFLHTEKKDWLKDKTLYVSMNGSDGYELCGSNESNPCLTVKKAFEMCEVQISLTITLMEGNHVSEATTIDIWTKKISVIGKGKETCSIGTGALSSAGALFSVTTGQLGLLHMKVDCNSNANPSSPSVVVVSDGGGSLSLEDVVITTSKTGDYVMSSSVFVVPLSQLSMVDVEIKDMNVSKSLFSEPDLSSSSSSSSSLSSLSSSALYLTATASGDSVLANVKVMNVKLTEGDGVVVAKSVKAGETFGMMSTRTEGGQSGCILQ